MYIKNIFGVQSPAYCKYWRLQLTNELLKKYMKKLIVSKDDESRIFSISKRFGIEFPEYYSVNDVPLSHFANEFDVNSPEAIIHSLCLYAITGTSWVSLNSLLDDKDAYSSDIKIYELLDRAFTNCLLDSFPRDIILSSKYINQKDLKKIEYKKGVLIRIQDASETRRDIWKKLIDDGKEKRRLKQEQIEDDGNRILKDLNECENSERVLLFLTANFQGEQNPSGACNSFKSAHGLGASYMDCHNCGLHMSEH